MSTSYGIVGRGWSFPPRFERTAGSVDMLTGEDDINSSLRILLTTTPGERIMLADYGADLTPFLFEPLTTTMKTLIADRLRRAILFYEPRITVETIDLADDEDVEGRLLITINYRERTTNSRFNFVFDYYVKEATELRAGVVK